MAVLFGLILPRVRRRRERGAPITLVPIRDLTPPPRPRRARPVEQTVPPSPPAYGPPPLADAPAAQRMPLNTPVAVPPAAEYPPLRLEVGGTTEAMFVAPTSEGRASQFRPPQVFDGTLQFLPGRMEMIEGSDTGQDVRFVRAPSGEPTTITFGRAPGTPYRHVQLHEATVSRHHARMTLAGKRWELTNLSQTNPVIVNGQAMNGEGDTVTLEDGDRVEMGEVVFRFHAT
jgi:hypothetical protein